MNRILKKRMWLAGASLLAIVLGSGDANAQVINSGSFILPARGWYDFTVAGAQGGNGGGLAVVGGELFFNAGAILSVVVGGVGERAYSIANGYGGGGGGGSFGSLAVATCYLPQAVVAVAIFSTSVVVRLMIRNWKWRPPRRELRGRGWGRHWNRGFRLAPSPKRHPCAERTMAVRGCGGGWLLGARAIRRLRWRRWRWLQWRRRRRRRSRRRRGPRRLLIRDQDGARSIRDYRRQPRGGGWLCID